MGLLRLLLAISVFVSHSKPLYGFPFVGGMMAVQAFYMISGFYMAMVLREKYARKNGYRVFIVNRFLRLYPTYAILSLIVLACGYLYGVDPYGFWVTYGKAMSPLTKFLLLAGQIPMLGQDLFLFFRFEPATGALLFTPLLSQGGETPAYLFVLLRTGWTLGVEVWFYLLAPFLVRLRLRWIGVLMLLSLALRGLLYWPLELFGDPWTYRFFPTELLFFLAGILGYRLYKIIKDKPSARQFGYAVWAIALLLTCCLGAGGAGRVFVYYPLMALAIPFVFLISKRWKFDRFIGELSYPLYLSHLFIFELNRRVWQQYDYPTLLLFTIIFSVLIVLLIEKPMDKWRQRRVSRVQEEVAAP